MVKTALYIRVSTDEQAKHGYSLGEQEKSLLDYVERENARLDAGQRMQVVGIYRDEGYSAHSNMQRRKGLGQLLADCENGRVELILFIKLDRWFRNLKDFLNVQDRLDSCGATWRAIFENYDSSTAMGRMMINYMATTNQAESERTSERIKDAQKAKRRNKEALCGNLPYGYYIGQDKRIHVDREKAETVREMFKMYLRCQNVSQVMVYAHKATGRGYATGSIRRFLANRSYIGEFYGEKDYAEPIVDVLLFHKVQELLEQKRRIGSPKAKHPENIYLFSGLLRCPTCGNVMVANAGAKTKSGEYNPNHRQYRCGRHNTYKTCTFSSVLYQTTVEKYLVEHFCEMVEGYSASYKEIATGGIDYQQEEQVLIERRKRLVLLYADGMIEKSQLDGLIEDCDLKLKELQAKKPPAYNESLEEFQNVDFKAVYSGLSDAGKKEFWHCVAKSIKLTYFEPGRNGRKEFEIEFL